MQLSSSPSAASLGINGTKSTYVPPHLRNAQRAASTPSPSPSTNGYVVCYPASSSAVDQRSFRTGWNDPRASPRSAHESLRGGHNERSKPSGFVNSAFGSPRIAAANDWAGRPSTNGWSTRESRGDGAGVWRNGAHVVGTRNMRLEKELFGDPSDPSKQHTGINFEKYDDIPVEATGAGVPEPVTAFTNPPLDPVLLENISFAYYSTPTPVQKYSIPIVAANRDLMACAQASPLSTLLLVNVCQLTYNQRRAQEKLQVSSSPSYQRPSLLGPVPHLLRHPRWVTHAHVKPTPPP